MYWIVRSAYLVRYEKPRGVDELSGLPVSVCSEKAIIIAYSRGIVMKDTMATSTTKTHDEDGSGK